MISFIIPTFNEQLVLPNILDSLRDALDELGGGRDQYEIIVADDESNDYTPYVAKHLLASYLYDAKVIPVSCRNVGAVRNAGVRASTGDILVFLDADTKIDARVITAIASAIRAGAAGGSASARYDRHFGRMPWRMWWAANVGSWLWQHIKGWGAGCCLFVRRDVFDRIGGFDERCFAGEDAKMAQDISRVGRFQTLHQHVSTSSRRFGNTRTWRIVLGFFTLFRLRSPAAWSREAVIDFYRIR